MNEPTPFIVHYPQLTVHHPRSLIPKLGAKTSEFWLLAATAIAAMLLILAGWQTKNSLKALSAPAMLAGVYALLRTWLKRETIKLLTETPNMTIANPIAVALSDPAKYVDTVLENIVKSKLPAVAAYQPQVDAVIEAGVTLGWAVLEKAVLAKLVVKYPQLAAALSAAGVTL